MEERDTLVTRILDELAQAKEVAYLGWVKTNDKVFTQIDNQITESWYNIQFLHGKKKEKANG